jgi:SGNH domain (fused to AT3 domains)
MIPITRIPSTFLRRRGPASWRRMATTARSRQQLAACKVGVPLAMVLLTGCGAISGNNASNGGASDSAPSTSPVVITLSQFATLHQVKLAVQRAENTTVPPPDVAPSLQVLANDGDFGDSDTCPGASLSMSSVDVNDCIFGDVFATRTMVLTGDSRAQMWFNAIDAIATANKYKLVFLAKGGCPAPLGSYEINNDGSLTNAPWTACSNWHKFVAATIARLAPRVIIVSTTADLVLAGPAHVASPTEETADMLAFLHTLPSSAKVVVLGGFPQPGAAISPTLCLSRNAGDIAKCAFEPSPFVRQINSAMVQATQKAGVAYINQEPWLCGKVCPAVIADIVPYTVDGYHIDNTYTQYLTGVLWSSLKSDLS